MAVAEATKAVVKGTGRAWKSWKGRRKQSGSADMGPAYESNPITGMDKPGVVHGDQLNSPAGPNKKEPRDFTDYRTQEEMDALHAELQAIKPTADDFLLTPPKSHVAESLRATEKYAERLRRDLGVISMPVETSPGRWSLKIEKMPPAPSVSELKQEIQKMYEAAQRGEKYNISFGVVGPEEAAKIKAQTGLDALLHRHELNLDDIRHAVGRHGDELAKGQVSISQDDFVRYAEILADPHSITKGSKPGSIVYSRRYPDGTVFAIEQQLKGKKLSFRTLWKQALGGTMVAVLVAADQVLEDEEQ